MSNVTTINRASDDQFTIINQDTTYGPYSPEEADQKLNDLFRPERKDIDFVGCRELVAADTENKISGLIIEVKGYAVDIKAVERETAEESN